jgi:GTP cyclohydrolase I
MSDAYIFVGSNIERETNYLEAVKRLRELGTLVAVSPVYDTPALGDHANAPRFYNGAVWLETDLLPHVLRNALREIESQMGRVRTADKFAPRPIDLDLALYGEVVIDDGELTIPDPDIFERGFMARALAHVNPNYVIPPDGPTLAELACRLRGQRGEMHEVPEMSIQVEQLVQKSFQERMMMSESKLGIPSRFGDEEWRIAMPEAEPARQLPAMRIAPDKTQAHEAIADAVRSILLNVGEDPTRAGLLKTPERVARAYDELLAGYDTDPAALVNGAFFETDYHDMVVVKDIEFYSLCEHHILPFFGKVHVAYIPDGQVIGLSKIPRIVDMYARRLQLQEKMTYEIANFLQDLLHPRGVAVIVTGQHMCSMMRGVNKSGSKMVTQVMYGEFQEEKVREQLNERLRQED